MKLKEPHSPTLRLLLAKSLRRMNSRGNLHAPFLCRIISMVS